MSEMIDRGAEAMRAARRERINQPLDRIWPDLMRAAAAVVIEECASVADRWPESIHDIMERNGSPVTAQSAAASIAYRIRDIADDEALPPSPDLKVQQQPTVSSETT